MGCFCQWELKAPTDRSRSDCVHEQVAKRIANVRFTESTDGRHCRCKIKAGQQTKRLLYEVSGKEAEEVWEAVGCEECLNTGYSHRRAIYEMFELNETTKNMIRDGETAEKIRRYQRERGFLSLQEQAAQMVMNGEMDMEEAEKVIYSAD